MPKAHERHALRVRIRQTAQRYGEALSYDSGPGMSENHHDELKRLTTINRDIFKAECALNDAEAALRLTCSTELNERWERLAARKLARDEAKKSQKVEFGQA